MTTPLYLDDLAVGQMFTSSTVTVEPDRVKAFAEEFDPQPFHLDEAAGERRRGRRGGDRRGVAVLIDVAKLGEPPRPVAPSDEAVPLEGAGTVRAHGHAQEHLGVGSSEPDRPPTAVESHTQHRVGARGIQRGHRIGEESGRHLRCVHADEQRRAAGLVDRGRESDVQGGIGLRYDVEVCR